MISENQKKILETLIASCNQQQLIWLCGYLQGCVHGKFGVLENSDSTDIQKPNISIYYATETGNTKMLSLEIIKPLRNKGFKAKSININRVKPEDLKKEQYAIFLISTHGEGDPPESAAAFFSSIEKISDNSLNEMNYAVLGLGDKSYNIFCGAAITLDSHLKRLGAKNFHEISLFDVDYVKHIPNWIDGIIQSLNNKLPINTTTNKFTTGGTDFSTTDSNVPQIRTGKGYNRLEPLTCQVTDIVNLNDVDSNKQTYHIELTYNDDITYTPGDAVGIILPSDNSGKEMAPRLYSIASSPSLHKNQIHLTVALASYINDKNEIAYGVASSYLANRNVNDTINFYIHQNHMFNLPRDDQDIIMICAGTGIAPFRSFIYERQELGHTGRNWLFFGNPHAHCDFLYQSEWQEHLASEALNRIDLAFSRDQEYKIYVQHRLQERANDIFLWLENGAVIYVCGAKDPMSKDVEQALIDIISSQKSLSKEQAIEYLANLEQENRYLKDVY